MINLNALIQTLQKKRPVFHSEDDLKLALSMEIFKAYPEYEVRLEKPIKIEMTSWNGNTINTRAPIDMVLISNQGEFIPIELKYKTKNSTIEFSQEMFELNEHGATDIGRYSFRKDIYRIEQFLKKRTNSNTGFVLIITNESDYFDNNVSAKNKLDKFFSFHDNAVICKLDKGWNYDKLNTNKYVFRNDIWKQILSNKAHWTCTKELYYKLDLLNEYDVRWKLYSNFGNTKFKYCLIKIKKSR